MNPKTNTPTGSNHRGHVRPLYSAVGAVCGSSLMAGPAPQTPNTSLMYYLAQYLGPYSSPPVPLYSTPSTSSSQWYSSIFQCPSARTVILAQNGSTANPLAAAIYYLAPSYIPSPGLVAYPFGYPGSPSVQPMRLVNIMSPGNTVALEDVDQLIYGAGSIRVARNPVHGSCRNTLYFDGHVNPVSTNPVSAP